MSITAIILINLLGCVLTIGMLELAVYLQEKIELIKKSRRLRRRFNGK